MSSLASTIIVKAQNLQVRWVSPFLLDGGFKHIWKHNIKIEGNIGIEETVLTLTLNLNTTTPRSTINKQAYQIGWGG